MDALFCVRVMEKTSTGFCWGSRALYFVVLPLARDVTSMQRDLPLSLEEVGKLISLSAPRRHGCELEVTVYEMDLKKGPEKCYSHTVGCSPPRWPENPSFPGHGSQTQPREEGRGQCTWHGIGRLIS